MSPIAAPRTLALAALAVVGLAGSPTAAHADPYCCHPELERLARQLERRARDFDREVDESIRRTPEYARLRRHADVMVRLADRIAVEAWRRDVGHLVVDMERLHELDRHVRHELEALARREISPRHYHHLRQELAEVSVALHRLHRELDSILDIF
jgi:hypothetical protein